MKRIAPTKPVPKIPLVRFETCSPTKNTAQKTMNVKMADPHDKYADIFNLLSKKFIDTSRNIQEN